MTPQAAQRSNARTLQRRPAWPGRFHTQAQSHLEALRPLLDIENCGSHLGDILMGINEMFCSVPDTMLGAISALQYAERISSVAVYNIEPQAWRPAEGGVLKASCWFVGVC